MPTGLLPPEAVLCGYDRDLTDAAFDAHLAKNLWSRGVMTRDLRPALRAAGLGEFVYDQAGSYWSAAGARRAAGAVAAAIRGLPAHAMLRNRAGRHGDCRRGRGRPGRERRA